MRYLLTMIVCFCFYVVNSQPGLLIRDTIERCKTEFAENEGWVVCKVEIEAQTNWNQWQDYLTDKLKLDDSFSEMIPPGKYTVIVQFVIDPKGIISDVNVVQDPGYGLGKRAEDAVSKYKGKWTPAQSNGHATYGYRKQPITFLIEEEEKECETPLAAELML